MINKFLNIKNSKIAGIYLLFVGIVVLAKILFLKEFKIIYIILILLVVPSIDFTIRGISRKKKRGFIIPGITFGLTSIFLLIYLIFFDKISFGIAKIWPIFGLFPSFGLIAYYAADEKKEPRIIIPAIFLGLLSIIFILYTCGVISFKFRYILLLILPMIVIFFGLYFIFNREIEFFKKKMDKKRLELKKNKKKTKKLKG